ncbi:DUF4175 family protein [Hansschlegelia beijingensis]
MAIEERGAPRESRLEALIWRARFALFWESAWPWLAAALAVVVLFLTVSWLGLWDALEQQKGGADFAVVPVSFDLGSVDKPKAFLKEIGAQNLPLYADPSGKMLQTMKSVGRGSGLPTTLILDRSGCEIAYLPGPAEWASAEGVKLIDAALGR